jgi:choice-of-anchor A domain-containing protein
LSLGMAAKYGVLDYNSGSTLLFNGSTEIVGDVALAQNTRFNFSRPALIVGSLYEDSGVTGTNNGIIITGGTHSRLLSQAVADANSASSTAAALPTTGSIPGGSVNVTSPGNSVTFNGMAGQNVVDLTNFSLAGGGTFTIHGTSSETFIFNVSGNFRLPNGQILLTGGVTPDHVLFNITGSGSTVSMSSLNSDVLGTILAPSRAVNLSDGTVVGEVISGQNISITGNTAVVQDAFSSSPAVPEPAAYVLAGSACVFGLGAAAWRKRGRGKPDVRAA